MAQALAKARKRLTHDERHEHLLDVAAKLMLEHGFEAVTMEALKDRAGVSRGLTYTHFEDAGELVFALYEREMTELERRLDSMATAGSFDERVKLATRTYFDFAGDRANTRTLCPRGERDAGRRVAKQAPHAARSRAFELRFRAGRIATSRGRQLMPFARHEAA